MLKTIHRIYFGFDGEPDPYLDYLETWKRELPEYEIKHWNASNLPMDINEYVKKLYNTKDAIFLSDFFRWWVLKVHGGVYLNADIEIVDGRKFNALIEDLEKNSDYDHIIGLESTDWGYTTHSMAAKPNSKLSEFMCGLYENSGAFIHLRKKMPSSLLVYPYFVEQGIFQSNEGFIGAINKPEIYGRVKIYPVDYFSPRDFRSIGEVSSYTGNTCLCHHFKSSWIVPKSPYLKNKLPVEKQHKMLADYLTKVNEVSKSSIFHRLKKKILTILRRIIGIEKIYQELKEPLFLIDKHVNELPQKLDENRSILEKKLDALQKRLNEKLDTLESGLDLKLTALDQKLDKEGQIFLRNLPRKVRRIFYVGTPEHSNLGDLAIAAASLDLLKELYPESNNQIIELTAKECFAFKNQISSMISHKDIIFMHGGGNMGNLYLNEEEVRRFFFKNFPRNKIISMPQSVTFTEDEEGEKELAISQEIYAKHKDLILIARDEKSYSNIKEYFPSNQHALIPDSVLFWETCISEIYKNTPRNGVLFLLREDKEKVRDDAKIDSLKNFCSSNAIPYTVRDSHADHNNIEVFERHRELESILQRFAQSKLIITDRYHGLIFSVITGTPCIVFKSLDHKISEGSKWFKHLSWVHYIDDQKGKDVSSLILKYVQNTEGIEHSLYFTEKILKEYKKLNI